MPVTTRPARGTRGRTSGNGTKAAHAAPKPAKALAPLAVMVDPVASAKAAHLRYVSDTRPGIRRKKAGRNFSYIGVDGRPIHDRETLERIKHLGIPPAWTDVWICPDPNGHLQATGRDAKGRKQYRYHERWREVRDETKYERMVAFTQALPKIRARVEQDLALPGMPKEKVLATVVRLLETTLIRVGNDEYAKNNHHYGLTTLRNKHVEVTGSTVRFHFTGKSGKKHFIELNDPRLARIVKKSKALPGYELFEYTDESGEVHPIGSGDVNEYLKEISGEDFTAKDFRTWSGTVLAALALQACEEADSETQRKKNVTHAIEEVAGRLGNTPAVCRKCYVHPDVINAYLDGTLADTFAQEAQDILEESGNDLRPEEHRVLEFLIRRLEAMAAG